MKRRAFLATAGGAASACMGGFFSAAQAASGKKPNIIFVLADDLGIGNVSCYGADNFKTPNIDRLAGGGIRFTRGYTAPLCGPSRALIMTGRYAFRTGATNQDATGEMKPSVEMMLPQVLKQAGYATASVGKWSQLPLTPADFGCDEYLKFQRSGVYWNTQEKGKSYEVNGQSRALRDREYLPDVMHDFVANFINRRRESPFFIYYSMSHIHADILPTPDSAPGTKDFYADNVAYMDKLVGKLVAHLDRLKLRENTLILFVGDNGAGDAYADRATIGGRRLAGEKGSMLEGGALVPLIANWPGTTLAGKVSSQLVDSTDFLPTFAELAGAPLPPNRMIDGRSFAPQLRGLKGRGRDWIYVQLARKWYVRDAAWKLNQDGQLFDMSRAPFEEREVSVESGAAASPRKKLQAALDQLNPAGGILDQGDGTGRHAKRDENRKRKTTGRH